MWPSIASTMETYNVIVLLSYMVNSTDNKLDKNICLVMYTCSTDLAVSISQE